MKMPLWIFYMLIDQRIERQFYQNSLLYRIRKIGHRKSMADFALFFGTWANAVRFLQDVFLPLRARQHSLALAKRRTDLQRRKHENTDAQRRPKQIQNL